MNVSAGSSGSGGFSAFFPTFFKNATQFDQLVQLYVEKSPLKQITLFPLGS